MSILLAATLLCQPTAPQPPARLELRGGIVVTADDYLQHLYASIGSARLRELLLDRVIAAAVATLPADAIAPEVAAVLQDPDAEARRIVAARVRDEHGGDRQAYRTLLETLGVTPAEDLWSTRLSALREARIAALVQSERQPTPERLRRVFDEHYGVDGMRVVVRHVFQSFGAERHKAREAGRTPAEAEVEEAVRKRVAGLMALHEKGTPFHLLVARGSEDPSGRVLALDPQTAARAGEIEGYNFQHFGPEFAEVVRSMQPGEVRGPVRTSHGYHIVELVSVVRTDMSDVEPRLRELLRREPPSLAERRLLLERLSAESGIDGALRR